MIIGYDGFVICQQHSEMNQACLEKHSRTEQRGLLGGKDYGSIQHRVFILCTPSTRVMERKYKGLIQLFEGFRVPQSSLDLFGLWALRAAGSMSIRVQERTGERQVLSMPELL